MTAEVIQFVPRPNPKPIQAYPDQLPKYDSDKVWAGTEPLYYESSIGFVAPEQDPA